MKEFDLKIPVDLSCISLRQYQEYLKLYDKWDKEDDDYIKIKMLQIFCDLSPENIKDLELSLFDSVISHLLDCLQEETPLVDRFYMDGKNSKGKEIRVTYGFIPSLDKMSFGEYIDLNTYINDWSQMHKAMAVLFRPTIVNKKTVYDIEKYQGSYKYSDVMLDMPVNVALGAIVFFYRLMNKLPKLTLDYFQQEMKKGEMTSQLKGILGKDGDSINRFTRYVKEMSQESMRLQVPIYINV
jgi:hypothetical protein